MTDYKTIAESNNFIVLDKYAKESTCTIQKGKSMRVVSAKFNFTHHIL